MYGVQKALSEFCEKTFLCLSYSDKDVRSLCCYGDVWNDSVIDQLEEAMGSFEICCAKTVVILNEYRSSRLMICRYRA